MMRRSAHGCGLARRHHRGARCVRASTDADHAPVATAPAAKKPAAKPKIAREPAAKPAKTPEPKQPREPALKKSISSSKPDNTIRAAGASSAPSAFEREQIPAVPFTPPEKLPPAKTQQAALQSPPPAGPQGDVAFGALSARLLSRSLQGGDAPRQRAGRSGRDDAARRTLLQRLRRSEGRQEGAGLVLARSRPRRPAGDLRARDGCASRAAARRRTGPRRRRCWRRPPSSAMSRPPTISRCSTSKASRSRKTSPRAAELLRTAADAGSPEAQYALATLYKEGSGVPKDPAAAAKLLAAAARGGNAAARGRIRHRAVQRHRPAEGRERRPPRCSARRRCKGSAVAQNRLARILATGRGMPTDPVAAIKWHTIAKAGGASDVWLENFMQSAQARRTAARARTRRGSGSPTPSRSHELTTGRSGRLSAAHQAIFPPTARSLRRVEFIVPAQSALLNVMDRRRAQGRPQPQARLRRGREPAGLAQGSGELRLGGRSTAPKRSCARSC